MVHSDKVRNTLSVNKDEAGDIAKMMEELEKEYCHENSVVTLDVKKMFRNIRRSSLFNGEERHFAVLTNKIERIFISANNSS